MSQTVTLAGVRTRNGVRAANIIALLSLARIWSRDHVWVLGEGDVAVRVSVDTEILHLSSTGLNQGLRDRVYLMPLDCAQARCREQPKDLKLVPEASYAVFSPGEPTYARVAAAETAAQGALSTATP